MYNLHDLQTLLGAMMTPATMITACSLLLLGVYDKYSKIVASIRALSVERRQIGSRDQIDLMPDQERRDRQIGSELAMLRRRLNNVLLQVRSIVKATAAFLAASLLIGAGTLWHWNTAPAAGVAIAVGFLALLFAMVFSFFEIPMIGQVVSAELPSQVGDIIRPSRRAVRSGR